MARILLNIGRFLVFSRRNKNIRGGLLPIFTNLLLIASVIFSVEILLIVLGIGEIFLPLTTAASSIISRLIF